MVAQFRETGPPKQNQQGLLKYSCLDGWKYSGQVVERSGPSPAMKLNIRSLRSHPLLSLLPATQLRELLSETVIREFHKGTVIFREGESSQAIYLLLSGRCQSSHLGERGTEVVDEVFGPGDTLGEREMLNQEPYRSTVRVISRCVVLPIQGQPLQEPSRNIRGWAGAISSGWRPTCACCASAMRSAPGPGAWSR
ncbi:MAG: cyclic nucleotide-binding domain-containing protein [Chthoniobacteraceae bacterium]